MSAMITVTAFVMVIVLVTILIARYHLPPFPVLIGAALLYGIAAGNADVAGEITGGIGAVFALLGIPIYSGAVIAQALRQGGFIPRIAADLAAFLHRPALASGFAGYLLSIPFMCCITPFIILSPVIEQFTHDLDGKKRLLYIAAYGSVVSFVLLFPLPITLAVVEGAVSGPFPETTYAPLAVIISLPILLGGIRAIEGRRIGPETAGRPHPAGISRTRAWLPIALPILLILAGIVLPGPGLLQSVSVALFAGAIAAILVVSEETRLPVLASGTKHAGIILLDICGAGALGGVVAASTFAVDLVTAIPGYMPLILIPFILAAMIQTAQGSRVVTAVVSSAIIADTPVVHSVAPISLVLMVSAGTLVFSYVSDPYFWLIRRETEDGLPAMVRNYTLPLASAGLAIFIIGLLITLVTQPFNH